MSTKTHMQRRDSEYMHAKTMCGDFHGGYSTEVWESVNCKKCIAVGKKLGTVTSGTASYVGKFPGIFEQRYHGNRYRDKQGRLVDDKGKRLKERKGK